MAKMNELPLLEIEIHCQLFFDNIAAICLHNKIKSADRLRIEKKQLPAHAFSKIKSYCKCKKQ